MQMFPSSARRCGDHIPDFVLYDDFTNQQSVVPIANLMTHASIKGNLQMLGGKEEPLDKVHERGASVSCPRRIDVGTLHFARYSY